MCVKGHTGYKKARITTSAEAIIIGRIEDRRWRCSLILVAKLSWTFQLCNPILAAKMRFVFLLCHALSLAITQCMTALRLSICHFAFGSDSATLVVHEMDRQHPTLARTKARVPAGDSLAENSPPGRSVHGLRKGGG
jgi:hypothetical protein